MSDIRYQIDVETAGAQSAVAGLATSVKALGAAFALNEIAQFSKNIIDAARSAETLTNQLRLVTAGTQDLARVTGVLQQAAVNNRASFAATTELYTKLKISTEELGLSEERLLGIQAKFTQALAVSGAGAATADGAIRQFGQAMASGVLRGDEFNSIVEALGPALNIMARESGTNVGELRKMAEAGELTSEKFLKMLESSRSLTDAFNQQVPSIANLETRLGDAFDRALVKLGEVTGLTQAYKNLIEELTRTFDKFSGATGALVNQTPEKLMEGVEKGSIQAQEALNELNKRVEFNQKLLSDYGNIPGTAALARVITQALTGQGGTEQLQGQNAALTEYINRLKEKIAADKEDAAIRAEEAAQLAERTRAYKELLAPYQAAVEIGNAYVKMNIDNRDALSKNRDEQEKARSTVFELKQAQELAAGSIFDYTKQIEAAEARVIQLEIEYRKLIAAFNSEVYGINQISVTFDRILEQQNSRFNRETEYLKLGKEEAAVARATENLREQIKSRTADIEERINRIQATGTEEQKRLIPYLQEELQQVLSVGEGQLANVQAAAKYRAQVEATIEAQRKAEQEAEAARKKAEAAAEREARRAEERRKSAIRMTEGLEIAGASRLQDMYDNMELDGLTGINKTLREIEIQERKVADAARQRLVEQFGTEDPEALNARLQDVTRIQDEITRKRQEAAASVYEEQRSFSYGWRKAWEQYADDATNNAKKAERLFKLSTQGMEDAIVGFAKTGKFEWKDFVSTILEELLRSGVRELMAEIFGGTAGGNQPGPMSRMGGGYGGYGGMGAYSGYNQPAMRGPAQQQDGIGSLLNSLGYGYQPQPQYQSYGNSGSSNRGLFGSMLSGVGDLFSGFFANGGTIPAGRFGIVGEAGPEFVGGPATVTPMTGTNVVYNINAVDASSFQALLAKDPSFLYAVTEQGRRSFAGAR